MHVRRPGSKLPVVVRARGDHGLTPKVRRACASNATMLRAFGSIVLALTACSSAAEPVAPFVAHSDPAPAPSLVVAPAPLVLRECGPQPERLWPELAHVEVARPASVDAPFTLSLPPGMTLPPRLVPSTERCAPVDGLRALSDVPIERCCDRGTAADATYFADGCLMPTRCRYRDAAGHEAGTPTELARLLAPIESGERALALVAMLYPEVLDPALLVAIPGAFGMEAIAGAPAPFEVRAQPDGFIVHVAAHAGCGCVHHLVRLAFMVGRDGCVVRLDEPLVPLAWAQPICAD